jgi:endonuclease YncB( thermonuclease family)
MHAALVGERFSSCPADLPPHQVSDGDTITVLVNKKRVRLLLESIDVSESKQAFACARSSRSRAWLGRYEALANPQRKYADRFPDTRRGVFR